MTKPKVIGLSGWAGVGKDTVADLMCQFAPHCTKLKIADSIKAMGYGYCMAKWGINSFTENRHDKAVIRPYLEKLGSAKMDGNKDYWLHRLSLDPAFYAPCIVVVADVRRKSEIDWIHGKGGKVVWLGRHGVKAASDWESAVCGQIIPDYSIYLRKNNPWTFKNVIEILMVLS